MKKLRWSLVVAVCFMLGSLLPAQSIDAFVGFNTLITKTHETGFPKLGGGLYPSFGGDFIFFHGFGIGAQVAFRATQSNYFGNSVRPILYDFNIVWEPVPTGARIRPDLAVGVGADSLRVYQGAFTCGSFTGCTNYTSSNHFILHAAVGVKLYLTDHIFLRPSVDYYNIRHDQEFLVPSAYQAGIAIGYTLGPSQ